MVGFIANLVAVVLAPTLGFAWLAFVQRKPFEAVFGRGAPVPLDRRRLLIAGYGALAISGATILRLHGTEFAVLLWPLSLGVGAVAISMTLTYAPQLLAPLARPFVKADEKKAG
ncbi:MAG: DUF3325 domain-containing protein [Pseudomonadota bacterium]